jgi:Zn-dependent protease
MRYTLRIATFFGIPVRVHATFPLVLVAFGAYGLVQEGVHGALYSIALVLVVFVCVVLHEMGHSLQVRRYGVVVRDIVLLPIGGVARAERIPDVPRQEIIMAIAGPAVNVVLAAGILVVMWLSRQPVGESGFLSDVLIVNVGLALFNLVPAFPMDGGRILRAFFATRMPYIVATRYATNVALLIAQLFAVIGFATPGFVALPLIAVLVFAGALSEERMIRARVSHQVPAGVHPHDSRAPSY